MPKHQDLTEDERDEFDKGGGLKPRTVNDRAREAGAFYEYFWSKANGQTIESMVETEDGCELFNRIFAK